MMRSGEEIVGLRVKSLISFSGVPEGTEGVIDQTYYYDGKRGVTIAWDLPDRPLPKNWKFTGQWAAQPGVPLRDGFYEDEFKYLEVVK